jgi:hypothetical protein
LAFEHVFRKEKSAGGTGWSHREASGQQHFSPQAHRLVYQYLQKVDGWEQDLAVPEFPKELE